MGILSWIVLGLIAGVIAKVVLPGKDPGGMIITILLGIGGAFVGGFIATKMGYGDFSGFDMRSLLMSIGGALVILIVYRMLVK